MTALVSRGDSGGFSKIALLGGDGQADDGEVGDGQAGEADAQPRTAAAEGLCLY